MIAGRYRLTALLGRGGMGEVWRAEHVRLRSPVAIKLIDKALAERTEAIQRFLQEAQAAAALRSPHVVQMFDQGVDDGVPYIAMELLEGESLAQRLARVGKLSPLETHRILNETAKALAKAHEAGIVHRDLKPDNVFLAREEDHEVTKLLDFGIAKVTSDTSAGEARPSTRTGALLGTPHYMSPEQAEGTRAVDHRTDVWALAVIAFECLTGQRPFQGEALGELVLKICTRPPPIPSALAPVPPGFDAWFARGASREVEHRFASAKEAVHSLAVALDLDLAAVGRSTPAVVVAQRDVEAGGATLARARTVATPAPSATGDGVTPSGAVSTEAGATASVAVSDPKRGRWGVLGGAVAIVAVVVVVFGSKLGGGVPSAVSAESSVAASAPAPIAASASAPAPPEPEPSTRAVSAPPAPSSSAGSPSPRALAPTSRAEPARGTSTTPPAAAPSAPAPAPSFNPLIRRK